MPALTETDVDETSPGAAPRPVLARLGRPVDGASLAVVRMSFGLLVAVEGYRYVANGWIELFYGSTTYTFTYWPFDFIQPLPPGLRAVPWLVMVGAGLALAAGMATRLAAATAWVALTYAFLLDKSQYLNHLYLMALLAFLLIVVPTGRVASIDARSGRGRTPPTVPAIGLFLIRFQIAVPYLFGGLAKLNGDWLRGRPLADWLAQSTDIGVVGPTFGSPTTGVVAAWLAVVVDLGAVVALGRRRLAPTAFIVVVAFHLLNARLFNIGVFPWLMIATATVFWPPSWPRQLLASPPRARLALAGGAGLGLVVGIGWFPTITATTVIGSVVALALAAWLATGSLDWGQPAAPPPNPTIARARPPLRPLLVAGVALWVAVQLLVPLRHHLYASNVHWAEDGRRFSWHMKLRDKEATIALLSRSPDGEERPIDLDSLLTPRQIDKMAARPDMIVQFARVLDDRSEEDLVITARSLVSLNGRPAQAMIDPSVDLTALPRPRFSSSWFVVPLEP